MSNQDAVLRIFYTPITVLATAFIPCIAGSRKFARRLTKLSIYVFYACIIMPIGISVIVIADIV
jgi:hypothetical protein